MNESINLIILLFIEKNKIFVMKNLDSLFPVTNEYE